MSNGLVYEIAPKPQWLYHLSSLARPSLGVCLKRHVAREFSQWEHIFANPMATAAAIDRVVHHSVILEFDVPSYRTTVAELQKFHAITDSSYSTRNYHWIGIESRLVI